MLIKDKPNYNTKQKPITFLKEELVIKAIKAMAKNKIGSIVITDEQNKVIGIVTERDLVFKLLAKNLDPKTTKLSKIMSTELKLAYEDDDLVDWMHTMSNERFRHLPVIDKSGKLVNMMSQGDFLAHTWPDLYEKVKNDLKGRLGKSLQILLFLFAVITLGLIALKL